MSYVVTEKKLAAKYNASTRTVRRWKRLNAPFDDEEAMQEFIKSQRTRLGVSKLARRSEPATVRPIREVVAKIVPAAPRIQAKSEPDAYGDAPEGDDEGTLRRLEEAERLAYKRFVDSAGSERAGQLWLLCADQLRKFKDSAAKHADDVSERETRFMATCCEVIDNLWIHLQTAPKLIGVLCEGLTRDVIASKVEDQLRRTIEHAVSELADQLRGTSLERLLPR